MKRYVVEGIWTGYTSFQQRVVHRTVHTKNAGLRAWIVSHDRIGFTDGTDLVLSVRDCKPREKVKGILDGYGTLIRECYFLDATSVYELQRKRQARDALQLAESK